MLLNKELELPWKPYWPKTPASLYYSLYVSTTTSLRSGRKKQKPLFCIPLLQCIHIQEMLVVHRQTLNQQHGPKHPITSFSDRKHDFFVVVFPRWASLESCNICSSLLPWCFAEEIHLYTLNWFLFFYYASVINIRKSKYDATFVPLLALVWYSWFDKKTALFPFLRTRIHARSRERAHDASTSPSVPP